MAPVNCPLYHDHYAALLVSVHIYLVLCAKQVLEHSAAWDLYSRLDQVDIFPMLGYQAQIVTEHNSVIAHSVKCGARDSDVAGSSPTRLCTF